MAIGFKHGTGGIDPFGFTVVHNSAQPSDPKENTIWINTTWAANGWTFGPELPLRRSATKNFVTYPYYSSFGTSNGITYTDLTTGNADRGKFSASGTATKDTIFRASYTTAESGMFLLPAGTYTMSGCPAGGIEKQTYALQLNRINDEGEWEVFKYELGSGRTFTVDRDTICNIGFRVWSGATLDDLEVYFQIEEGSTKSSFEIGNASGQLWFRQAANSYVSLEALKRNSRNRSIILQPVEAYIFRRTTNWEGIGCKIYQNGEWKDLAPPWDGYYFKAGDEREDITGGWTGDGWAVDTWPQADTVQMNTDHIYFECGENYTCMVGTAQKVDLTDIRTLKADVEIVNMGQVVMYICASEKYNEKAAETEYSAKGTYEYSLDVSSYTGSYYIMFYMYGSGAKGTNPKAKIMNVWGE